MNFTRQLALAAVCGLGSSAAMAGSIVPSEMFANASMASNWSGFYFEVSGQSYSYDYWGSTYEPWTGAGGAAGAVLDLGGGLTKQIDLRTWWAGDSYYDGYYASFGTLLAAHVNYDFGGFNAGAFSGLLMTNGYYESGLDVDFIFGAEAKVAPLDELILDGQIGIVKNVRSYYPFDQATFGQVAVRYFPMDNLKLELALGGLTGQVGDDPGETAATTSLSGEVEFQFPDTPYSGFVHFNSWMDHDNWDTYGGTTVSVGARAYLDGGTLKDANTTGAQAHKIMDMNPLAWLRLDGY
jgi:hypothetical protein